MDGYTAATYGDRFADVYDDWYEGITDAEATADVVASLARASSAEGGRVVELGVGTGRLAMPLAHRGLDVIGVDASPAMLEVLRAKPGAGALELHLADLGDLDHLALASVDVALLAFNTLFNLTTEAGQLSCLRAATSWLAPGGSVVVEAFVPADDLAATGRRLEPTRLSIDEVVLTVSEVGADGMTVSGQHVHIRESGIRLRPWRLRLLSPAALDAMARQVGLVLRERWSDWTGRPFGEGDDRHVSVYGHSAPGVNDAGAARR